MSKATLVGAPGQEPHALPYSRISRNLLRPPGQPLAGVLVGFTALASCACGVDGNGHRTEQVREVGEFTKVENDGELDVAIEQGKGFSVVVSIDSNLQSLVEVDVAGDTLHIDVEKPLGHTVDGPHVWVTLPTLRRASLDGSGRVTALGFVDQGAVDLRLDGSGQVRFSGGAERLKVRHDGSGEVELEGYANRIELALDGSGAIHAKDCPASEGEVSLSGSGEISATVVDTVDVSLSGSGRIEVIGGADVQHRSKSGSGSIHIE